MSEDTSVSNPQDPQNLSPSPHLSSLSISIWPPSQRTRESVTGRLVETLSSATSILAKRYGVIPHEDAVVVAGDIERAAFASAEESAAGGSKESSVEGGLEILEIYSKEISRRMLQLMKERKENAEPPSVESLSIADDSRDGENVETEAPAAA